MLKEASNELSCVLTNMCGQKRQLPHPKSGPLYNSSITESSTNAMKVEQKRSSRFSFRLDLFTKDTELPTVQSARVYPSRKETRGGA